MSLNKLRYFLWLWRNRYEWWDQWWEATYPNPDLTHEQFIALVRAGNELRSFVLAHREEQE